MGKEKKPALEDLKVQSFVTNFDDDKSKQEGTDPTNESYCYSCYELCG